MSAFAPVPSPMLTVSQAATILGLSSQRVRALITAGRLKATKHGERVYMIRAEDLEAVAVRNEKRGPKVKVKEVVE